MRKLGIILMGIIIALQAYSQEEQSVDRKTARKLAREQRKVLEEINAKATNRLVDSLIRQHNFVIKADYLGDQIGNRIVVDQKVNFIYVDSSNIVIQYGSINSVSLGYNGLGGVTTEGNITKFEVSKTGRNNDAYFIEITAVTTMGIFDIFINVSSNGNATATIGGTGRGKLIYYGDMVPVESSRIYKGSVT